jgi:GNAT superfamily N-acetyltransferase
MIKILEATISDLGQLAGLFDLYRQFYRQATDVPGAKFFLADRISNKESVIYVAVLDKMLTGFVQCYPIFSSVGMKRTWLLNDLYVRKDFRGQGISKLLIDRCKQLARDTNANGLLLETEKTNAIGNNLYPSTGFALNETTHFYFWTRE